MMHQNMKKSIAIGAVLLSSPSVADALNLSKEQRNVKNKLVRKLVGRTKNEFERLITECEEEQRKFDGSEAAKSDDFGEQYKQIVNKAKEDCLQALKTFPYKQAVDSWFTPHRSDRQKNALDKCKAWMEAAKTAREMHKYIDDKLAKRDSQISTAKTNIESFNTNYEKVSNQLTVMDADQLLYVQDPKENRRWNSVTKKVGTAVTKALSFLKTEMTKYEKEFTEIEGARADLDASSKRFLVEELKRAATSEEDRAKAVKKAYKEMLPSKNSRVSGLQSRVSGRTPHFQNGKNELKQRLDSVNKNITEMSAYLEEVESYGAELDNLKKFKELYDSLEDAEESRDLSFKTENEGRFLTAEAERVQKYHVQHTVSALKKFVEGLKNLQKEIKESVFENLHNKMQPVVEDLKRSIKAAATWTTWEKQFGSRDWSAKIEAQLNLAKKIGLKLQKD